MDSHMSCDSARGRSLITSCHGRQTILNDASSREALAALTLRSTTGSFRLPTIRIGTVMEMYGVGDNFHYLCKISNTLSFYFYFSYYVESVCILKN